MDICTVENNLKQQNLGLWSARHRAYDHEQWREIVETATLLQGHAMMSLKERLPRNGLFS